jgi:hypothetical protein
MTPEGLRKESKVDRTHSITPNTGKKLDRMIMVVLALALGYLAFDKFVLNSQRDTVFDFFALNCFIYAISNGIFAY